jgi:hypothetical protein
VCVYESESERGEREKGGCKVSLEDRKIEKMSETAIHGVEREGGRGEKVGCGCLIRCFSYYVI